MRGASGPQAGSDSSLPPVGSVPGAQPEPLSASMSSPGAQRGYERPPPSETAVRAQGSLAWEALGTRPGRGGPWRGWAMAVTAAVLCGGAQSTPPAAGRPLKSKLSWAKVLGKAGPGDRCPGCPVGRA